MLKDTLNHELLASYAPKPGRHALLPELSARQTVALLCRVLYREGTTTILPVISPCAWTMAPT